MSGSVDGVADAARLAGDVFVVIVQLAIDLGGADAAGGVGRDVGVRRQVKDAREQADRGSVRLLLV